MFEVITRKDITYTDLEAFEVDGTESAIIVPQGTKGTAEIDVDGTVEVTFPDGPLYFEALSAKEFLDFPKGTC